MQAAHSGLWANVVGDCWDGQLRLQCSGRMVQSAMPL